MATVKMQVHEVVEFPITSESRVAADWGTVNQWPGAKWKYVHRYAEELRAHYRAKFGRGHYRIKIEKRRCEYSGRHIARIVVLAP